MKWRTPPVLKSILLVDLPTTLPSIVLGIVFQSWKDRIMAQISQANGRLDYIVQFSYW